MPRRPARRWTPLLALGLALGCPSNSNEEPTSSTTGGSTSTTPATGTPSTTAPDGSDTSSTAADTTGGPAPTGSTTAPADSTGPGDTPMRFFVTSVGNGDSGGDYGGLAGADARCQELAAAAGAGDRTWRAYLSQAALDGARVVHARDRIGEGPWANAAGATVAQDLGQLHQQGIDPALMLDEQGAPAGKGAAPGPEHDIITGSDEDGMLWGAGRTCSNWTSSDPGDQVRVGHHDWSAIPMPISPNQNWVSVHDSPCDAAGMAAVLGSGRLYCFAID